MLATLGRVLGALAMCAVAGFAAIRMLRGGTWLSSMVRTAKPKKQLALIDVLPLGGKSRLVLVRMGQEQLLLAQSETGLSLLRSAALNQEAQP
jgi:flagellar biogenesis protein FliO